MMRIFSTLIAAVLLSGAAYAQAPAPAPPDAAFPFTLIDKDGDAATFNNAASRTTPRIDLANEGDNYLAGAIGVTGPNLVQADRPVTLDAGRSGIRSKSLERSPTVGNPPVAGGELDISPIWVVERDVPISEYGQGAGEFDQGGGFLALHRADDGTQEGKPGVTGFAWSERIYDPSLANGKASASLQTLWGGEFQTRIEVQDGAFLPYWDPGGVQAVKNNGQGTMSGRAFYAMDGQPAYWFIQTDVADRNVDWSLDDTNMRMRWRATDGSVLGVPIQMDISTGAIGFGVGIPTEGVNAKAFRVDNVPFGPGQQPYVVAQPPDAVDGAYAVFRDGNHGSRCMAYALDDTWYCSSTNEAISAS
jgi:hypothetical protein